MERTAHSLVSQDYSFMPLEERHCVVMVKYLTYEHDAVTKQGLNSRPLDPANLSDCLQSKHLD